MTYAYVTFNFFGNEYSDKKYKFKTSLKGLKKGDVVAVESNREENGESIAVFVRYVKNRRNRYKIKRKEILKKANVKTLADIAKQRIERYKNIEIPEGIFEKYRKSFKVNGILEDEKIRKLLVRNICMSSKTESGKEECYHFGNMMIVVRDNEIISLEPFDKESEWIRPRIVEKVVKRELVKLWN